MIITLDKECENTWWGELIITVEGSAGGDTAVEAGVGP